MGGHGVQTIQVMQISPTYVCHVTVALSKCDCYMAYAVGKILHVEF